MTRTPWSTPRRRSTSCSCRAAPSELPDLPREPESPMSAFRKSTIVRPLEWVAPRRLGRRARDLWFTVPPRMSELPVPEGGEPFEVEAQGHLVRGLAWGSGPTVYLMHGWGGRGSQFGAMVLPLVGAGRRVVMYDAASHGDSDPGPAGEGSGNGMEFA